MVDLTYPRALRTSLVFSILVAAFSLGGCASSNNDAGGGQTGGAGNKATGGTSGGTTGGTSGSPTGGTSGGSTGGTSGSGSSTGGTSGGSTGGAGGATNPSQPISPNIVVDQFGYRTGDQKIAVIRNPQTGFDAGQSYTPGSKYALVDAHSGQKLLEAAATAWNGGMTDSSSGDKAWWFDFSTVTTASDYFVLDESANVRSDVFAISDSIYRTVLVQAERMLFYQRDGFAKTAQYAGADWVDGAAHTGNCYLYSDSSKTLNKDLHGGWWDAGDFNKYTNWGASDVIELMRAYTESPSAFSDATNINESGNGVADILDEVKWELDWLVRMQQGDGSVLSIVGEPAAATPEFGSTVVSSASPNTAPSLVTAPCDYGPASTSASLSTAAALAYASVVFGAASGAGSAYPGYAAGLAAKAQAAWTWAQANSSVTFHNSQSSPTVGAGEQEVDSYGLTVKQLQAALYLFEATGTTTYRDFFDANYNKVNFISSGYIDGSHGEEQETLLAYTLLPNATSSVVQKIKTAYQGALQSSSNLGAITGNADPYMAYLPNYFWGINQVKSDQGNLLYDVVTFGLNVPQNATVTKGAEGYLHYLHGTNPLQLVYLSNMGGYGAQKSVTRFFHSWFTKGSYWDAAGVSMYGPPPGYLTGGANPSYTWDSCCPNNCSGYSCGAAMPSPPAGQPNQKSYLDFNDNWPLDSWSVTEPDDGYQAKYIRLLSKFVE